MAIQSEIELVRANSLPFIPKNGIVSLTHDQYNEPSFQTELHVFEACVKPISA